MAMASPLINQLRTLAQPPSTTAQQEQIRTYLDSQFSDLDALLHPTPGQVSGAGTGTNTPGGNALGGPSKRRRKGLEAEIGYWQDKEARAAKELEETTRTLPAQLESTQAKLQALLSSAQDLSLKRYKIADQLAGLVNDLGTSSSTSDSSQRSDGAREGEIRNTDDEVDGASGRIGPTVLEQLEKLQDELSRLEAGLAWSSILEQVISLSERSLDPASHRPSPLAAVPHYIALNDLVMKLEDTLPSEMALMGVVREVKERTWKGLKDLMSENLLKACEPLGWPKKVVYESVPLEARRAFERAYQDLLFLQAEGEDLHGEERPRHWATGVGLYPLQAMVKPIELRFRYHFQGKKGTNRVDKPEWAFANILDQVYEHQAFLSTYLQSLSAKAGYEEVDIKSEFTLLLFPILLSLLRSRIPHLLDHPALLAHTVYQTVVFDEAIKEGGFELDSTSLYEGRECGDWEGLSGVVLREEDWYARWLTGEKQFADGQLNDMISSQDAWIISEEAHEGDQSQISGLRPTVSARQVRALIEQITDRYAPLPELNYKLPFLLSIQLPILLAYHTRISGSLDAFETLSLAFVRAVPGALAGNTRSGVHIDQAKLTSGKNGLERLIKAWLSGRWVVEGMRKWADDLFFVELSAEFSSATAIKWKYASDPLVPLSIKSPAIALDDGSPSASASASVFDVLIDRYNTLSVRAEDMIVKLVTVEVENELKLHLTRRWDNPPSTELTSPSSHLLAALTIYSSHLKSLSQLLPPLTASKIYRRIVEHLSNHILQRGVYAGWSKFSEYGGRDLVEEVKEWKMVSSSVLSSVSVVLQGGTVLDIPYEVPWKKLEDISRILSLPTGAIDTTTTSAATSASGSQPIFAQAMASAWDGEEGLNKFCQRLGVDMGREELQAILRRRVECWR